MELFVIIMKKRNAILLQLFARVWPLLVVLSILNLEINTDTTWQAHDPYEWNWPWMIFTIILIPYCVLVYKFLPNLIFPSIENNLIHQFMFWVFTSLTAGLGPVLLYWLKVDKDFTAYIQQTKINEK